MADPTVAPGYNQEDQNNLIAKQFGQQKQALVYQKQAALDQANQGVDRQQAIAGFSGGTALKAKENAANAVNQGYATQTNDIAAQQAAAQQQSNQFGAQYGLQNAQFEANKNQFAQQMAYQYKEFNENQKTNLINAVTALKQAGLSGQIIAPGPNPATQPGNAEGRLVQNVQAYGNMVQPAVYQ